MSNENIERELLERISGGDETAFSEIFHTYGKRLYPFILRLLHSEVWAEEVVQDVFERLWINRANLVNVNNLSAYIYKVAANRTLDYIKHHQKQQQLQYQLASREARVAFASDQVAYKFVEQLFANAVNELPPQRKKVYQLVREEEMSYSKVAEMLGISRHTVRNHMAEALESIRQYLLKHGDFWLFLFYFIYS